MNRHATITLIVRTLLFAAVVLLVGNGKGYAQEADIKTAIDTFHAALGSLDASKMEPLWAHHANVISIQPRDKSISVGWDAVKKDWETTFGRTAELKFTEIAGPYIQVRGDVAWATGIEEAVVKVKATGATLNAPTYDAMIFEKRGGQWLLVSQIALRVSK
jgi:ketosteroid isomerase-like protein